MLEIGKFNSLKILKFVEFGLYLDVGHVQKSGSMNEYEILLPNRDLQMLPQANDLQIGDQLTVFVCYDSDDRLIATTKKPKAQVGEFALLKVVATEKMGAFLDWGLAKDLFLPFAEQSRDVYVGLEIIVFIYLDKSQRISASMRIERHLDQVVVNYKPGQAVQLMIFGKTDLGYKAIINGQSLGMLFKSDVFQELKYAQTVTGFIKNVRPDGKINLVLAKSGHHGADDIRPLILDLLNENKGFYAINDKTSAEKIYQLFGVSKKKFKMALGGLYKSRLIQISDEGIRLLNPQGD